MIKVKFADECIDCDCCGEKYCIECNNHYSDCVCVGPSQEEEYEYIEIKGKLYAKKK